MTQRHMKVKPLMRHMKVPPESIKETETFSRGKERLYIASGMAIGSYRNAMPLSSFKLHKCLFVLLILKYPK